MKTDFLSFLSQTQTSATPQRPIGFQHYNRHENHGNYNQNTQTEDPTCGNRYLDAMLTSVREFVEEEMKGNIHDAAMARLGKKLKAAQTLYPQDWDNLPNLYQYMQKGGQR